MKSTHLPAVLLAAGQFSPLSGGSDLGPGGKGWSQVRGTRWHTKEFEQFLGLDCSNDEDETNQVRS
jgi:hypothetical protein